MIRKARLADIPAINRLWGSLISCHVERCGYGGPLFRYRKGAASTHKRFLAKCIRSRNRAMFVAEEDGGIVGYINASIEKLPPILVNDKEAHINGIFIKEGHRRRGLGKALFLEAERWAKGKGAFSLGLMVSVHNKDAKASYESLGFEGHHLKMSRII